MVVDHWYELSASASSHSSEISQLSILGRGAKFYCYEISVKQFSSKMTCDF